MNNFFLFGVFVLTILDISSSVESKKNVVCYFSSWTVYRPGNGSFKPDDIDPHLCTHINYAFVGLNPNGSINILDSWEAEPSGLDGINKLIALKKVNPSLKVMVSMGGWNEGSATYSQVAANQTKRDALAKNVLEFLEKRGFDGFDLDWEYPGERGGDWETDRDHYTALIKAFSDALKPKGYLLSAAVAADALIIDNGYDAPELSKYLDMLNVMAFDFHGAFNNCVTCVGHVSPLYGAAVDSLYGKYITFNVDYAIQHWMSRGFDQAKINLGIAQYGRSFTLADKRNTSLYAPITGGGKAGPYSFQEGVLGYNEICEYHSKNSTYVWDDEQKVPHRIWDDQWVGFEDVTSVKLKVQYANKNKLGGIMVFSLDYDDFRGICGSKYPLLTTINKYLQ
ncbi:unnamed protein product [Phyllotreta striolata]|uniref:GH18 domain-containing protein n=1 Tax=Phyllotreta striolata TaxID=444603 RepID=A0A9N9TEW9_PHYSR|nr:unnamed protein product [Phyllotreta striolata]